LWHIETKGTWTLSAQYGSAAVTVNIPVGGIKLWEGTNEAGAIENTANAWTLAGIWNNGFGASVGSSIYLNPTKDLYYTAGTPHELTVGTAFSTLTNVTKPGTLPTLGP
jgi:hypothetical protein